MTRDHLVYVYDTLLLLLIKLRNLKCVYMYVCITYYCSLRSNVNYYMCRLFLAIFQKVLDIYF